MTTRVPIRYGGTGANTAASARTALGVAPAEAFDVANTASSTANSAYNQANSAFAAANTANTNALNAYSQANTARDTANSAYAQANSDYQPAVTELAVTNNGATAYRFDQYGSTIDDPTIYVRAGETIAFNLNNAGHPFAIRVSNGGANYDTGLTHVATDGTVSTGSSAQGKVSGKLYWKVPYELLGNTYVYQCTAHSGMVGNIVIEPPGTVVYAQANAAYDQANSAYAEANLKLNLTGGSINGSLNISGNLFVSGNTSYINVATFVVDDALFYIAANNTLSDVVDIGFVGAKNSGPSVTHTGLARDAGDGTWYLFDSLPDSGHQNNVIDFANTTLAVLRANINANSILLTGNAVATQSNLTIAYNQANSAYGQANLAYSQANAAYGQANLAYTAANNSANTVRVSQNSSSTLSAKQLNFVNTANVTITVTDSGDGNANIAIFSAAGGGGGGGGANVEIKEDGTTLTTAVTSIDFTGGGVTATANGSNVTVSIPTGLSNTIIKTTSYTSVNAAANLTYALPIAPFNSSYIFVIKNGVVLTPNTDYTVSNSTLTVIESGAANDAIEVRYFDQINVLEYPNTKIEVDSNTVASQTNTFYVTSNVSAISRLSIAKNGLLLTPNLHFTVTGNTVTLNTAAEINDVLTFTHIRDLGPLEGSGLTQYTYNTNTASVETIDSWSKSTYRSGKYQIQIESGTGYYATEIMIIHDDSTTNLVQYGTSSFGSNVGAFSSDISGSNVRLLFTATDATSFVTYNRVLLTKRSSESFPTDLMTGNDAYDLMITLPFNPIDLN